MADAGSGGVLAATQGDPSGIGVEIAIKVWLRRDDRTPAFFLLADPGHVARTAALLGAPLRAATTVPQEAARVFQEALPIVPLANAVRGTPGLPHPDDAAATIESIDRGVTSIADGLAAGVVTNPISKDVLYKAGFRHPGHTEYLGELAERWFGVRARPVMMLWSPDLAVVPTTIHIPLQQVFTDLTSELIVETGKIVAHDLQTRFGTAKPRLAISGLNPHAGENGSMGRQEIETIAPAIARLREAGYDASGPWPADAMFHAAARARYDVAICMYHDQALIPIKTLAFDRAVNVTLGLPFVRTSPDHGTAYDIAGAGTADCSSFEAALALASRLAAAPR
jgi:4-hydroxythreonine-4-phosphate dehydrogenase